MRLTFEAIPDSVPAARRALEPFRGELPATVWLDLRLLVSELVTNAVRHGPDGPGARVLLVAELGADAVRVEVHDDGAGVDLGALAGPAADGTSGWGLHLVGRVARRWGVEPAPGAHVWFELATV